MAGDLTDRWSYSGKPLPVLRGGNGYNGAMLLFKKKFLDAIRSGEKTQTVRLWKHRMMKIGQRSYIPGIGYIRITAVDEVQLEELTDADAVPDGFPTADALRAELHNIYGEKLAAGHKTFRVVFHILEES